MRRLVDSFGTGDEVATEAEINYMTGHYGTGPAYPALLGRRDDARRRCQRPAAQVARRAVGALLVGTGRLFEKNDEDPEETVTAFIEYRGVTAAALQAMQAAGFENAVSAGLPRRSAVARLAAPAAAPETEGENRCSATPALQVFTDAALAALAGVAPGPEARTSLQRIAAALATPAARRERPGSRLPVCAHLDAALAIETGRAPLRRLIDAFRAFEPDLEWVRRASHDESASANFVDGHANAMILGPPGSRTARMSGSHGSRTRATPAK